MQRESSSQRHLVSPAPDSAAAWTGRAVVAAAVVSVRARRSSEKVCEYWKVLHVRSAGAVGAKRFTVISIDHLEGALKQEAAARLDTMKITILKQKKDLLVLSFLLVK